MAAGTCGDSGVAPPPGARFRLRPSSDSEPVHLEIAASATVAQAESLLRSGDARWAIGAPRRGDGGFNAPWHWHIDPATVSFAEITIEACQATPSYIEQNLDYWLRFGQVCIMGVIEARER